MTSARVFLFGPLVLLATPFLLLPAALGFLLSFTNYAPGATAQGFIGLDGYRALLGDPQFVASLRNVAIFALVSVPLALVVGFAIAYLLREPFAGRGIVRVILLVPWLVSPVANGVMWHYLLTGGTGLLNYIESLFGLSAGPSPLGLSGLALPAAMATEIWRKAPLAGFLLLPGLLAIPRELWEQATLEGASITQRVRHVALPALRPLLVTVALLLTADALGAFDGVLILTGGGPGTETLLPGLYSFQRAFQQNNWAAGATGGWIIAAAVLLVGSGYVVLIRRLRGVE